MDTLATLGFKVDSRPLDKATKSLDKVGKSSKQAEQSTKQLTSATKLLASAITVLGVAQLTRSLFETVRATEQMKASLKTVTGSVESASDAWSTLTDFAKTTPFTMDQSVQAFIKMRALGLNPTTEALNSFGNTAAAMGKDLNQMIEAVADATTGEFERLKEFGIKSKSEGDKVSFTFQGVTTTVGKNSSEINKYLQSIGDQQFAGAMADQMNTLNGQISNLEDSFDGLLRQIGDAGATAVFKDFISTASDTVTVLSRNLDVVGSVAAGLGAAASAYVIFTGVTNAATMAQVLFNAAARVNPYIFIATSIVGATAAVYAFMNAQESALEVWNKAIDSEAAYKAAQADVSAANRIQEITKERMELIQDIQELEREGFKKYGYHANQYASKKKELVDLEKEYHAITDARIAATKAQSAREAARQAEVNKQKQAQLDIENAIAAATAKSALEQLEKDFVNPWQSAADSVAQSLQDAIASGDWDSLGEAIGNTMATSIAGVVNKNITDKLAKGITENSAMGSQIAAAFGGPIAGAIVGGVVGSLLSSGSIWDPTDSRQKNQGTGTVLSDISAKSESIVNATENTASATNQLVGLNRGMLMALQNVRIGIQGGAATTALALENVNIEAPRWASPTATGALNSKPITGTQVDEGIEILGGTIGELISSATTNAFASFNAPDHLKDKSEALGSAVDSEFQSVFSGIYDSVVSSAEILGINAASRLKKFQIETQKISLEGLSADEQQAEIESYFSTVFDGLAGASVPFLEKFQLAGEGLGETLARVSTNLSVTREIVDLLGVSFRDLAGKKLVNASERLIELTGGVDNLITSSQNFISTFASDAQQFDINTQSLSKAMGSLPLPETREGFYSLLQAQDASTAKGAENVATILRVQSVANDYYSFLEKSTEEQKQLVKAQFDEVGSAADSLRNVFEPLKGIQRNTALKTLERALASGDISGIGDAARIAANINERDFETATDYRREQAKTLSLLDEVQKLGMQKSPEQLLLEQSVGIESAQLTSLRNIEGANPATGAPMSNSGYAEIVSGITISKSILEEIKGFRVDNLAAQRAIEKNTRDVKIINENWDRLGLPETRDFT